MALLPEILLLLLALLVLGLDLLLPKPRRAFLGVLTALGTAAILAVALAGKGGEAGGPATLHVDSLAFFFRTLFLLGASIAALISIESEGVGRCGEYYALLLFSTLGMCLMASASDLVMLALAIEMAALPAYLLAGFLKRDSRSTEAGMKYFLFGATASAVMWYGFSLLYGATGETGFAEAAAALKTAGLPVVMTAVLPILAGLTFKVAAVPFHFWAPDVYEGAPTPVSAFLSTAMKAAGFAVILRLLMGVFPTEAAPALRALAAAAAAATMTLGNLLALVQKNFKRLLAYSAIAHAGYALIGLAAMPPDGLAATAAYLLACLPANLAAFSVAVLAANASGNDDITALAGLGRRSPAAALALLAAMLSLAGMPPFAGFAAKAFLLASAVDSGLAWLAAVGAVNSVIALYYYLAVLKAAFLFRSDDEQTPVPFPVSLKIALGVTAAAVLIMGVAASPWFEAGWEAVRPLFPG